MTVFYSPHADFATLPSIEIWPPDSLSLVSYRDSACVFSPPDAWMAFRISFSSRCLPAAGFLFIFGDYFLPHTRHTPPGNAEHITPMAMHFAFLITEWYDVVRSPLFEDTSSALRPLQWRRACYDAMILFEYFAFQRFHIMSMLHFSSSMPSLWRFAKTFRIFTSCLRHEGEYAQSAGNSFSTSLSYYSRLEFIDTDRVKFDFKIIEYPRNFDAMMI